MPAKDPEKKKKARKLITIYLIIISSILIFYVLHYVHVSDKASGKLGGPGIHLTDHSSSGSVSSMYQINIQSDGNGIAAGNKITYLVDGAIEMITDPFNFDGLILSHCWGAFVFVLLIGGALVFNMAVDKKIHTQDAAGVENGSAKWFKDWKSWNATMVAPYGEDEIAKGLPDRNVLIAQGLKLSQDGRSTKRNINTLVIGGSGTGKTFGFIKPNVAQMNASYVITDPSGEIMRCTAKMLLENGYTVRLFSTSDMKHTDCYNPFDYIYDESGAISEVKVGVLVSTFIKNAEKTSGGKSSGDKFWTQASTAWMTFAVLFLAEFFPVEKRNMANVLKLAQMGKADENSRSSDSSTELDKIVAVKRAENPRGKCFSSYDTFNLSPAKTRNNILISIAVDLNPFANDDVRNMTSTSYICDRDRWGRIIKSSFVRDKKTVDDANPQGKPIRDSKNIDLDKMGNEKTALFVNIPQANDAYNFIVAMMYSQMFDALYMIGEKTSPNRYHIFTENDDILSSMYVSKEEALKVADLYRNAKVVTETEKGVERHYIYNKEAGKEYTIVEKAVKGKKHYGYMKEVYSEKTGKALIEKYNKVKVKQLGNRLPSNVRFLLDEFANIGEIPNFEGLLSTMRKYDISATVVLQSLAQIKKMYDKGWEIIIGNCDTMILLGSSENDTCKYVSEKLGKTTIRTFDTSMSSGGKGGTSTSFKKQGRNLMDPNEIAQMPNEKCIVIIRGYDPFYLNKLKFSDHPNFNQTGDADEALNLSSDYIDQHFKCENKNEDDTDKMTAENNRAANINAGKEKDAYGNPPGFKPKKIKGKKGIAEMLNTDEDHVDEEATKLSSVDPADCQESSDAEGRPMPSNISEIMQAMPVADPENTQENDNSWGTSNGYATVTPVTNADPASDDSWIFC